MGSRSMKQVDEISLDAICFQKVAQFLAALLASSNALLVDSGSMLLSLKLHHTADRGLPM